MAIPKNGKNSRICRPKPPPTPTEIDRLAAEIRAGWTEATKLRRLNGTKANPREERWTAPQFFIADLFFSEGQSQSSGNWED